MAEKTLCAVFPFQDLIRILRLAIVTQRLHTRAQSPTHIAAAFVARLDGRKKGKISVETPRQVDSIRRDNFDATQKIIRDHFCIISIVDGQPECRRPANRRDLWFEKHERRC